MNPTRIFTALLLSCTVLTAVIHGALSTPRTPPGSAEAPPLRDSLPHVRASSQRLDVVGYSRDAFGPGWKPELASGRVCTARHATIVRQLENAQLDERCKLVAGADPYAPGSLNPGTPIEIDHVFPLSAAWDMGAHAWPAERRERFANDPINLVATSRQANQDKSDQLPSEWMPARASARCWYSRSLAQVAATYDLALSAADIRVMQRSCWVSEYLPGRIG